MFAKLPIKLPDEFFQQLRCDNQSCDFVAVHWDLTTGMLLREDGPFIAICKTDFAFFAIGLHPILEKWFKEMGINLHTGRHWLICNNKTVYVADRRTGLHCLQTQTLPEEDSHESGRYSQWPLGRTRTARIG